jgi:hypothetical protein
MLWLYLSSILCKYTSMNRLPSDTIFTVVVVFLQMHYMFRSTRPSSDATVHLTCFSSVTFFPPTLASVYIFGGVVNLCNSCQICNKINKSSLLLCATVYTSAKTYIMLWLKYFFPVIGSWFMVYVFVNVRLESHTHVLLSFGCSWVDTLHYLLYTFI